MSYVAITPAEEQTMLAAIGVDDIDALFADIPEKLRDPPLDLPRALSEMELVEHLRDLEAQNRHPVRRGDYFIGGGAYNHHVPAAVSAFAGRTEFVTAYTPYQAEISQGMLQAIFEYQTGIARITGLDASNASLYDGGTAVYEGCVMAARHTRRNGIIFDRSLNPNYHEVLKTNTNNLTMTLNCLPYQQHSGGNIATLINAIDADTAAVIVQYPDFFGRIADYAELAEACHAKKALFIVVANPIALGALKSPGEMGADIAVGEGQPLGLGLQYGGPFLGYIACREKLLRKLPGRLVGEAVDKNGKRGFTLTLQAREQHIRRERATSNICTNQALCALFAHAYMTVMGKRGFQQVSHLCLQKGAYARRVLGGVAGAELAFDGAHFNEFVLRLNKPVMDLFRTLGQTFEPGIRLSRWYDELSDCLLVAVTEVNRKEDIDNYALRLSRWLTG